MSQSHRPNTDTQAILQSMLERLKLQSGADSQRYLQQPSTTTADWSQHGGKGASYLQTVARLNNFPVNGFGPADLRSSLSADIITEPTTEARGGLGNNGSPREGCKTRKWGHEFGIPAWDSETGLKGREGEQPDGVPKLIKVQEKITFSSPLSVISSPTYRENTVSDSTGEGRSKQPMLAAVTPTGSGELFPVKTPKDADFSSFEKRGDKTQGLCEQSDTNDMKEYIHHQTFMRQGMDTNYCDSLSSLPDTGPMSSQFARQNTGANPEVTVVSGGQDNDIPSPAVQGFTPRTFQISGGEEQNVLHLGNGCSGALAQSRYTEIALPSQNTANSIPKTKQNKRPSETKTRRWTQRIKDRWRESHGSLRKKGKEGARHEETKKEKEVEQSETQHLLNMSNEEDRNHHSLIGSSNPLPSEDFKQEGPIRSTGNLEFGLGSFSLLEEIAKGQEWARFLNPTTSATPSNQRPAEQLNSRPQNAPKPRDQVGNRDPRRLGDANDQLSATVTRMSGGISSPVNMDIAESGPVQQGVMSEAFQPEPMEHGYFQSDMRPKEEGVGLEHAAEKDFASIKAAAVLDNLALKNRVFLNRKRVHQSQGKGGQRECMEEGGMKEAKIGTAATRAADERTDPIDDNIMMSPDTIKPFLPLSPSSSALPIAKPRGVLRQTLSQGSEASLSMETATKKRRVEDTRRVHFSEEVVAIVSTDLDLDATNSEEDSGSEENSLIEDEAGMEQAAVQEVSAPAPRPSLPAWILALKRRKTGQRPRQ